MTLNFWGIAAQSTVPPANNLQGNNNTSATDIDTLPCQSSGASPAIMIYLWLMKHWKKNLEHYCQKIAEFDYFQHRTCLFSCVIAMKKGEVKAYNNICSDWKSPEVFLNPRMWRRGKYLWKWSENEMYLHGFQQSYRKGRWNVTRWGWSRKRWKLSKVNNMIHLRKIVDDVKGLLLLIKLNIFRTKHLMCP